MRGAGDGPSMSFQIGAAIGDGIDRANSRTGGILALVMIVHQFVFLGAMYTAMAESLPAEATAQIGYTFPIPAGVAGVIVALGYLFSIAFLVVVTRALTRPRSQLSEFPASLYRRRIGWATLSAIGASIIVFVSVMVGMMLLVIPGIFLAISFAFYLFAVGVEDAGAVEALRRSWGLASGNRLKVFALVLVVGIGASVVVGVGSLVGGIVSPFLAEMATIVLGSLVGIAAYGVMADAFEQLREADGDGEDPEDVGSVDPAPAA